jgi:hypothetical protein
MYYQAILKREEFVVGLRKQKRKEIIKNVCEDKQEQQKFLIQDESQLQKLINELPNLENKLEVM